jgi:hypothetical protein
VVAYLMAAGPSGSISDDTARASLRTDNPQSLVTSNRLEIYQRHGKVKSQCLEEYGVKLPDKKSYQPAIVWMCQGRILKIVLQPFRKSESLYSVFCWEENEENIFGEGIPLLMEHCQKTYNTGWNITLDNAGVSAMPQIVIDKLNIEPADGSGDYNIRGGKVWNKKGDTYSNEGTAKPFEVFEIKQDIQQLFFLIDKSERTAYTLTGVTYVDRQNQSPDNAPVTLGATNIFQNNSTVSRRGLARQWDDNITLTVITRMYDFFMQYEDDDEIKHSMTVEPRGSTVLLAKELAANNLLQLYQLTQGGTAEGVKGLELLRGISVAMQFAEGKYIDTDDEMAVKAEAAANQPPDPTLELDNRKLSIEEAKVELLQAELNFEVQKYQADTSFKQELEQAKLELRMFELQHKDKALDVSSQVKMAQLQATVASTEKLSSMSNQNARDIEAARLQVKATTDSHDRSIGAEEVSLRARETALHEKELNHKITTGETGI